MNNNRISRGFVCAFLLVLCAEFPRPSQAWSPLHYRVTFYANRAPETRTWVEFSEMEFYSGATKQTVSSVVLERVSVVGSNPVTNLIDGLFTTELISLLPASGMVTTVGFTLATASWIDSYKVYTKGGTGYTGRDPKMWALSASADGVTYYPLHFVNDGDLPTARSTAKTFTVPSSITALKLKVTAVRSGGGDVEFSELKVYNSLDNIMTAAGATGLGDTTNSVTVESEYPKTASPVYVHSWQAADSSTATKVVDDSLDDSLYVSYPSSIHPGELCEYQLITGSGDATRDPVSWTLYRITDISAGGTPVETLVDGQTDVSAPTTRQAAYPRFKIKNCECVMCMSSLGYKF